MSRKKKPSRSKRLKDSKYSSKARKSPIRHVVSSHIRHTKRKVASVKRHYRGSGVAQVKKPKSQSTYLNPVSYTYDPNEPIGSDGLTDRERSAGLTTMNVYGTRNFDPVLYQSPWYLELKERANVFFKENNLPSIRVFFVPKDNPYLQNRMTHLAVDEELGSSIWVTTDVDTREEYAHRLGEFYHELGHYNDYIKDPNRFNNAKTFDEIKDREERASLTANKYIDRLSPDLRQDATGSLSYNESVYLSMTPEDRAKTEKLFTPKMITCPKCGNIQPEAYVVKSYEHGEIDEGVPNYCIKCGTKIK
jgi:hypothetical protein